MENEITMTVSPVCSKNGKSYAFVQFTKGKLQAEGKIPDCKVMSNSGFSAQEVEQLEHYMKKELASLKKMAAGIDLLGAFMNQKNKP